MKSTIIFLATISVTMICFANNSLAGETPSLTFLLQVADAFNKSLPMQVDKDTVLKSTYAQDGALGYLYVLQNYNANEIDAAKFRSKQTQPLVNGACTNPRMQRFFADKVDLIYSYYGKDMKFITEIIVTTKDCERL